MQRIYRTIASALSVLSLLAMAIWIGGLLVLGAIAAPAVFGLVPAPLSGDAMTLAFRRFDRVAMIASAVVLGCEVGLAWFQRPVLRRDLLRGAVSVVMSALAIFQGASLSPHIEALHRAGAVRGFGELGMQLEDAHRTAETIGKSIAMLGVIFFALLVSSLVAHAGMSVAESSSDANDKKNEKKNKDAHDDDDPVRSSPIAKAPKKS